MVLASRRSALHREPVASGRYAVAHVVLTLLDVMVAFVARRGEADTYQLCFLRWLPSQLGQEASCSRCLSLCSIGQIDLQLGVNGWLMYV